MKDLTIEHGGYKATIHAVSGKWVVGEIDALKLGAKNLQAEILAYQTFLSKIGTKLREKS